MFQFPRLLLMLSLGCVLSGCVTVQMPETSEAHPAHAGAASGEYVLVPTVLKVPENPVVAPPLPVAGSAPSVKSTTLHEHAPTAGDLYVCPMHPEVTSDKPGKCPKCGMDLELQEKSS